jgi:hypothetical protein
LLQAIALGLLTFVVTGVIAFVIAIPYFLLGTAAAGLDPITIIAGIFGLRELGGFFAAQFILILLIALLGDFGTAIISWFVNRSGKLAAVTFVSALAFQVIAVAVVVPATMKMSQAIMEAGSEHESAFERYAIIGEVTFELQEPFTDSRGIDSRLVEVSLFKKLILVVPISVSRAGPYNVFARYTDHSEFGETLVKEVRQTLSAGSNIVRIEFLPHQSRQYGYPSPKSVGGSAEIQLSYLVSRKALLGSLVSDRIIDQKILQQFMKDEGLDKGAKPAIVNKFVGRKEVQF